MRQTSGLHLYPSAAIPALLRVRIESFTWDRNAPAMESIARLAGAPEVIDKARELGLQMGPYDPSASAVCIRNCSEEAKPEKSLQTEIDSDLLTILNRIVHAHEGTVWAYSEHHCDKVSQVRIETVAQ